MRILYPLKKFTTFHTKNIKIISIVRNNDNILGAQNINHSITTSKHLLPLNVFSYTSTMCTICRQLDALQCNSTSRLALVQSCSTCKWRKKPSYHQNGTFFNKIFKTKVMEFNQDTLLVEMKNISIRDNKCFVIRYQ